MPYSNSSSTGTMHMLGIRPGSGDRPASRMPSSDPAPVRCRLDPTGQVPAGKLAFLTGGGSLHSTGTHKIRNGRRTARAEVERRGEERKDHPSPPWWT